MNLSTARYTGLHAHSPIPPENIDKFERVLSQEGCNTFNYLRVIRRIGTESFHATVWETVFEKDNLDIVFAVKIMLIRIYRKNVQNPVVVRLRKKHK